MPGSPGAPAVSVIMATYNGEGLVGQTIESVLRQTCPDFELVIVDDCSADDTLSVVRTFNDPRIRIFSTPSNLGPVGARNLAAAAARGRLLAGLDQDDLCLPGRLAAQIAYLDAHPDIVLAGTAAQFLTGARLYQDRHPSHTTPEFLRWSMHVVNPLIWSSVMMRADALRKLDLFERQEFLFAEDYDLYHRLGAVGEIGRLDEVLTVYRRHRAGASRVYAAKMSASATKVLAEAYEPWFGAAGRVYAELVVSHIAVGSPVPDVTTLNRVAAILVTIQRAFVKTYQPSEETVAMIGPEMSRLWWGIARAAIRSGSLTPVDIAQNRPEFAAPEGLSPSQRVTSGLIGSLRARKAV